MSRETLASMEVSASAQIPVPFATAKGWTTRVHSAIKAGFPSIRREEHAVE